MGIAIEWLNENSGRSFPLVRPAAGSDDLVPHDFLVDLQLFLTGRERYPAYLKTITYDSGADTYVLVFADPIDASIFLTSEPLPRLSGGSLPSRLVTGSGATVAVAIPGSSWLDPTWGGVGSWSNTYAATQTLIEQALVHSGPRAFARLMIDSHSTDPLSGSTPFDVCYKLVGGYNVEASNSMARAIPGISTMDSHTIILNAGPGAGDGYEPDTTVPDAHPPIRTINGQSPDSRGNIALAALDCVRVSQPLLSGTPLASTLELESDCAPCCGCANYRNVAAALNAKSAKLSAMAASLVTIYNSTVTRYSAIKTKLEARASIVVAI